MAIPSLSFCARFLSLGLLLAGCSAGAEDGTTSTGSSSQGGSGQGGGFSNSTGSGVPTPIGEITGKVLAPEGTIPISGALIYLADAPPAPIPDGVYCDACVPLAETVPHAFSNPDGTFTVPTYTTGSKFLVVQKGQFRRVRPFEVTGGPQPADASLTTFPPRTDKANGDDIPKIAIRIGQWDAIEDTLEKLGIAPDAFDRAEFGGSLSQDELLNDYATLSQYHIVFAPCSGSSGTDCNDSTTSNSTVKQNLSTFVGAGGKLYVTDYSYDFVRQPFPGYVDWVGQDSQLGSACLTGSYDAQAVDVDPGLSAWLGAQSITSFSLEASWTMIDKVNAVDTTDANGDPATVTPKVWVTGQTNMGVKPLTISFEKQCGRVLFSTYHTEGNGGSGLLPQELALLYVLFEVAVCVDVPIPQ